MKNKSNKKFVPSAQKRPSKFEKQGSKAVAGDTVTVSNAVKNKVHKPADKSKVKPWYARPASIAVFAFAVVAIITVVSWYFAGTPANNPAQNPQNTTQNTQPSTTPQNAPGIVISNAEVTEVAATSITVKWKSNIPCFGEAHATYTNRELTISSFPEDTAVTEHTSLIAGLAPSSEYKIEIVARNSKDTQGYKEVLVLDKLYQTTTPKTAIALTTGDQAPEFSLVDTSGKKMSLSDYKGKWVVLVFWDLACKSCKEELPFVNNYYKALSDTGNALLTVSFKGQQALVASYMQSQKFSFPALLDSSGSVCELYTIAAYPTTILVDGDGKIAAIKQQAFKSEKEISDFVQEGMKDRQP